MDIENTKQLRHAIQAQGQWAGKLGPHAEGWRETWSEAQLVELAEKATVAMRQAGIPNGEANGLVGDLVSWLKDLGELAEQMGELVEKMTRTAGAAEHTVMRIEQRIAAVRGPSWR